MRPCLTTRDALLLSATLLLALLLRLYALSGEMGPDSTAYAQYAWNLLHGDFTLDTDAWYAHRLPVFVPTALLYALAGVGRMSTAGWPLLLSLAQVAAAFLLGRRLFGTAAGALAAILLATLPLDAIEAGRLMPDVILGALLGIAGAAWMGPREETRRAPALVAGVLIGLATVVRPYALLGGILLLLDGALRRPLRPRLPWLALGVALVGLPLLLVYAIDTGDPLFRLHVVSSIYGSGVIAEGARLDYYPGLMTAPWQATGVHPLLLVGCTVLALLGPGRERWRLIAWWGGFFLFLQFGSMSLTSWVPILKRLRFLTPLALPAALLVASVLAALGGWTSERARWTLPPGKLRMAMRGGIVLGLLALGALCVWRIDLDREGRVPRYEAFEQVAATLAEDPQSPVYLDHWRTAIRVAYHLRFEAGDRYYRGADDRVRMDREHLPQDARLGYLRWYPAPEDLPAAWVVVDDETLEQARRTSGDGRTYAEGDIPPYAADPPAAWTLRFEGAGLRLYRTPGP